MITRRRSIGAAVLAAALLCAGCEDTPLAPGEGWALDLVAQPSVVTLDAASGTASSTLVATIVNDTGVPQEGVSVLFSNGGGTLSSGPGGVESNEDGHATTTLTVRDADPDSIEITATAGALTKTITVTKSTAPVNLPPVAAITVSPATEQVSGGTVVFDGSGSSDPDEGDVITAYKWSIQSNQPDAGTTNPRVAEAAGLASVGFPSAAGPAFVNVQDLTVTLSVTDDPTAPSKLALGRPVIYRASKTISYRIVGTSCATNQKPIAVIAGADTQSVFGTAGTDVDVLLDGSLSSDAESSIDLYTWTCGNGRAPDPAPGAVNGDKVLCHYTVDNVVRTYTATLAVRDQGINGGQCVQTSTNDTVQITVNP